MGAFALIFLVFIYIGLNSSIVLVAAFAGIAIFLWGAVVLPTDEFKEFGEYLWGGEFGEDLHDFFVRIIPGRGRGQVDAQSLLSLVAVVLALALVTAALASGLAAGEENQTTTDGFTPTQDCAATVHYDEFRTNEGVVDEANETGTASVTKKNTRVSLNDSDAFYRVKAENPNSYCVKMTVEISEKLIPPANLNEVNSLDETTTARWTDVYNFDKQTGYTELTFSVPANSTVTFAPSKPTVFLPAWRDEQRRDAESLLGSIKDRLPFGEEKPLEKRVYLFNASEQDTVTVRLDNPDSDEERIEDWNAVYRLDDEEPWKPVDTNTEHPVYYRHLGSDRVEFVMNDEDATIEFRANPTIKDEVLDDVRSYRSSWTDLFDFLPFSVSPGVAA